MQLFLFISRQKISDRGYNVFQLWCRAEIECTSKVKQHMDSVLGSIQDVVADGSHFQ